MSRGQLIVALAGIAIATSVFPIALRGQGAARAESRRLQTDAPTLRIATKDVPPFVFVEGDRVRGLSVDLWEEIARVAGLPFEWVVVDSVGAQVEAVESGRADAAIAAISRTAEREERLDFSYAYYRSGVQVMTIGHRSVSLLRLGGLLLSPRLLLLYAFIGLTLIVIGHVVWFAERDNNEHFPRDYWRGVWEGVWWAAVTVTTVGYGDRTTKAVPGRLMAIVWMFFGIFLVANFTAVVATELTSAEAEQAIESIEDLHDERVATVAGTTSEEYLRSVRMPYRAVATVQDAVDMLRQGDVDAVVYDAPVLLYEAQVARDGRLELVGDMLTREDYAIALPPGSPYLERVNAAILKIYEDGTYDGLLRRWSLDPGS